MWGTFPADQHDFVAHPVKAGWSKLIEDSLSVIPPRPQTGFPASDASQKKFYRRPVAPDFDGTN
jgi:hypothetical protein